MLEYKRRKPIRKVEHIIVDKSKLRKVIAALVAVITSLTLSLCFTLYWTSIQREGLIAELKDVKVVTSEIEERLGVTADMTVHKIDEILSISSIILTENIEITDKNNLLAEYNTALVDENNKLLNTVRSAAAAGLIPHRFTVPPASRVVNTTPKGEFVGVWDITFYNPVKAQTSGDPTVTASGRIVSPGFTIAVDRNHWKFGQKFYVEGWGIVEAADTGSKVVGRQRGDILIFSNDWANKLGRKKMRVWVLDENYVTQEAVNK